LPGNFQSSFDFKISTNITAPARKYFIAITIMFENYFRINQTLISDFQPDRV